MTIDWVLLSNWLIGGAISLAFGVVGGLVGSWIRGYFERKREKDSRKTRVQDETRQALLRGVPDFIHQQSKKRIEKARRLFGRPKHEPRTPSDTPLQAKSSLTKHWPFLVGLIVALSVSILVLSALGFWQ